MPFPSPHGIRRGVPPRCTGLDDPAPLRRPHAGLLASPDLQGRLLDGAAERERQRQGSRDRNLTFMAFKRAEASSPDWPPDKKATPGTAAGTTRKRQLTVASATSSTDPCSGQVDPGSTMLGLRIIPSGVTPWA